MAKYYVRAFAKKTQTLCLFTKKVSFLCHTIHKLVQFDFILCWNFRITVSAVAAVVLATNFRFVAVPTLINFQEKSAAIK